MIKVINRNKMSRLAGSAAVRVFASPGRWNALSALSSPTMMHPPLRRHFSTEQSSSSGDFQSFATLHISQGFLAYSATVIVVATPLLPLCVALSLLPDYIHQSQEGAAGSKENLLPLHHPAMASCRSQGYWQQKLLRGQQILRAMINQGTWQTSRVSVERHTVSMCIMVNLSYQLFSWIQR